MILETKGILINYGKNAGSLYCWCLGKVDMEKLQKISLKIIAGIGIGISLFLLWYSCRFTVVMESGDEALTVVRDNGFKQLFFLAGLLLGTGILCKAADFLKEKALHGIVIAICAAVTIGLLYFIDSAHAYPIADQGYVYTAAAEMLQGRFYEMQQGEYFGIYPFQLGLAAIYTLIFKIAGNYSTELLQMVHAVCVGLSIYTGFRITRELYHSVRAECIYIISILGFLPLYLYTLFIYGETIGICAALLSLWFFLAANRERVQKKAFTATFWLLAIAFMLLAYLVRSILIIVWIAMAVIEILYYFRNKKKFPLCMTVVMLVIVLSGQQLLIFSLQRQAGVESDSSMPVWLWLAMGLQGEEKPGSYNSYSMDLFRDCGYNREESAEYAKQSILNTINNWGENPKAMLRFFKDKILNQWNEPSYGSFTMTRYMEEPKEWVNEVYYGKKHDVLYQFLNLCQTAVYLLLFGYFISLWRENRNIHIYLPGLILTGGFLFSIIWEAKSRYIYPYLVIIWPCLAGSAAMYCSKIWDVIHDLRVSQTPKKVL